MTSFDIFRACVAVAGGAVLGLGFGLLQDAARRRHERREQEGKLSSGWVLMPGAGLRVAYFLLALAVLQLICPLLFSGNVQWFVSGGVALGYGWTLFSQLRQRLQAR